MPSKYGNRKAADASARSPALISSSLFSIGRGAGAGTSPICSSSRSNNAPRPFSHPSSLFGTGAGVTGAGDGAMLDALSGSGLRFALTSASIAATSSRSFAACSWSFSICSGSLIMRT